MANIVVVSGVHTTGDKGGMVNMAKLLRGRGHRVYVYPYPCRWALTLYSKNIQQVDAEGFFHFCRHKAIDVVVSHSNGSLVTQNAMRMGLNVKGWISFGGACTSDKMKYSALNFDWAISVYNPHDLALKWGARLPWHAFGRLGSEGYRGSPDGTYDLRWENVNGASSVRFALNHSHYTTTEMHLWEPFVHANAVKGHSQLQVIKE